MVIRMVEIWQVRPSEHKFSNYYCPNHLRTKWNDITVHLHPKTDKWDYLRSPIMKKNYVSCFDIGEVPRSHGKWNWNWLYFLPLIFTFEQGVTHLKSDRYTHLLPTSVGNDSSLARCWSDTRIYQHHWVGQIWKIIEK